MNDRSHLTPANVDELLDGARLKLAREDLVNNGRNRREEILIHLPSTISGTKRLATQGRPAVPSGPLHVSPEQLEARVLGARWVLKFEHQSAFNPRSDGPRPAATPPVRQESLWRVFHGWDIPTEATAFRNRAPFVPLERGMRRRPP